MAQSALRIRDLGYAPRSFPTGSTNSILDVPGVHISQITVPTSANLEAGSTASKGLTVICPRPPTEYYKPCHASSFTFNGNGELTGGRQIEDWGYINTPIAFTNSLSLGSVFDGMWDWIIDRQDAMLWDELTRARHYGTPIVGETADWLINSDTRQSRLDREDIKKCFQNLKSKEDGAEIREGQYGGGAGMTCHQFTGGTGTASRVVGATDGTRKPYTLAVLCQSNYGHLPDLSIGGVPVGKILKKEQDISLKPSNEDEADVLTPTEYGKGSGRTKDGSILILIITDGPLATHQLNRVARHATAGLALVGGPGIGRTFSGDIFLAVSTAEHGLEQVEPFRTPRPIETYQTEVVKNESIDAFFYACAEAVEEAVLNSIVGASDGTITMGGTKIEGLPRDRVRAILAEHLVHV